MSVYSVIKDVDDTLIAMLRKHFNDDSAIGSILNPEDDITLESPANMDTKKLSFYLFRVSENAFVKNQAMRKVNATRLEYPPFPVDLFYMVTPKTDNRENDHILLGKIMQIFYDNAIIRGADLQGDLAGSIEELRLVFSPMPVEELAELWNLFRDQSFMLSICYQVTPVRIDSTRTIEARRVVERNVKFHQIRAGKR